MAGPRTYRADVRMAHAIIPRRCPVEETAAPKRRSTRSFGEYTCLEDSRYASQQKDFPARGNRTRATGLSLGEKLPQEKKMRTVAIILGAAAAIAVAAPASADPAAGRVQLAQAQDAQSGSGMGASQQGSSGNRNSGAAARRNSQGGGAASRESNGGRTTMRGETQGSSRTTVRARSGGDRMAVHGRGHTTVGVRSAASDDAVIIKRKKARRYVYGEPSA